MYRVIECLTQEHDYLLLGVSAFVCVIGSILTVRTLRRVLQAHGKRKWVQWVLSGLVMGSTIWTTHFIAMLAYDPGVDHGYEPFVTVLSLGVAIVGVLGAIWALAFGIHRLRYIWAGCGFGVTVALMHYVGMAAYRVPGDIIWNVAPAVWSVILGAGLGVASFHRILRPVTRYCWLGGAALMVMAICAMHFTGMSAFEVRLDSSVTVPPQILSDSVLGLVVFSVIMVILFVGFSAISIENSIERETLRKLRHSTSHDPLTGLPNRQHMATRMETISDMMFETPSMRIVIVSIDLNHFKEVNEIHSHDVGDKVLQAIAARLLEGKTEHAFFCRSGGDKFTAFLCDDKRTRDGVEFAKSLLERISQPVNIPCENAMDRSIVVSASVGVAVSEGAGCNLEDVLKKSELAMYRAKDDPDLSVCRFDAEMDLRMRERMHLISDLRAAMGKKQFELAYQLQNDTGSREAVGCEVLLRWTHPVRGAVSPAEFIPLAEETGLIHEIGRWVLETACHEAASWCNPMSVAVNVAPQQLARPTFVEELKEILAQSGLAPTRLELEVTEASVINDQAYTLGVLKQVKAMGVRIAMDDFGTGYSSLSTLQAFPFDKIKIDRSFVTNLFKDPRRAAIVRSTLSLGEAFDIPVLAEGVETEEDLTHLADAGCHFVQGFLFGKPMTVASIRMLTSEQDTQRARA